MKLKGHRFNYHNSHICSASVSRTLKAQRITGYLRLIMIFENLESMIFFFFYIITDIFNKDPYNLFNNCYT